MRFETQMFFTYKTLEKSSIYISFVYFFFFCFIFNFELNFFIELL